MIVDEVVKIRWNGSNKKYYENLGYIYTKTNNEFEVKIKDLNLGSHVIILCKCDYCGQEKQKSYKEYNRSIKALDKYACSNCSQIKNKEIFKLKYGCENPMGSTIIQNKRKEKCLEKHGVNHYSKTDKFKKELKENCLEKHGVDHFSKTDEFKEKYKDTMLKNYNVNHFSKTDEFKEKMKNICLEKHGVDHFSKTDEFKEKSKIAYEKNIINKIPNIVEIINGGEFLIKCDLNKEHNYTITNPLYYLRKKQNITKCTVCNPIGIKNLSDSEKSLLRFIQSVYTKEIITNSKKIIPPYELDIYLPDLKLAFEFNGVYWHNELYKSNNYHKMKSDLCEEKGIQLIHIWEDDWNYKEEIIKSIILNKLNVNTDKIYARKCEIKEINSTDSKYFLIKNHIQGGVDSLIRIGLIYNNEIVSLMTFGRKRKMMNSTSGDSDYEMLRFCSKLNTNIVGGASKLFQYFIKKYKPKEITTFADRNFSNGKIYEKLGFNFLYKTKPNYYYVINDIRKHRFNFRKDILIKEGFDSNKSEHEIMLERNIFRVFNSGNLKYNWNAIQ